MKSLLNQKGTIQLPMIMLTLTLSLIVIFFHIKARNHYIEIKNLSEHYLCLKQGLEETKSFSKAIATSNSRIRVLFYSQALALKSAPKLTLPIRRMIQALKAYQKGKKVSFVKNIMTLSHCGLDQSMQFLQTNPYRNFLLLQSNKKTKRHFDQTLRIQRSSKKWPFIFINSSYLKKGLPFTTQLQIKIKDRFSSISYEVSPLAFQFFQKNKRKAGL